MTPEFPEKKRIAIGRHDEMGNERLEAGVDMVPGHGLDEVPNAGRVKPGERETLDARSLAELRQGLVEWLAHVRRHIPKSAQNAHTPDPGGAQEVLQQLDGWSAGPVQVVQHEQ